RNVFFALSVDSPARGRFLTHLTQERSLGFASSFRDSLGKIGEDDGEPEPKRHVESKPQGLRRWRRSQQIAHPDQSREYAADFNHEHDRVLDHILRGQLAKTLPSGGADNFRIE